MERSQELPAVSTLSVSPSLASPVSAVAKTTGHTVAPSPRHFPAARHLIDTGVVIFSLVLVIRVVCLEAYSVPTGSMAPAVLGDHWAVFCPRCGYPIQVGVASGRDEHDPESPDHAVCSNCGSDAPFDQFPISRGDQLLVNKSVFDWRRPRRWEMAVFRCPVDPGKEFVKRVVGLPGETVQIRDGDVWIDHEIARKSLEEFKRLRIPVFDNNYQPAPDGWEMRWEVQPPAGSAFLEGTSLHLDTLDEPIEYLWLSYRNWLLDEHKEEAIRDEYSYNGSVARSSSPVHDFMIECDLIVRGGDGWVAFAVTDGFEELTAELPVGTVKEGGRLFGRRQVDARDEALTYHSAPDFALRVGRQYHVELAFVDRRATLAIDGRIPFAPVDRPAADHRREVSRPVRAGARGVDVRVSNVRIFRDVHYTEAGRHGVRTPVHLGAGEYFVLGDNSPNSDDSRFWSDSDEKPVPVPESSFVGKPFLVHLPSRAVQWQALGRQWQQQLIDWRRVHWLR